jgi:hypothetical protein
MSDDMSDDMSYDDEAFPGHAAWLIKDQNTGDTIM